MTDGQEHDVLSLERFYQVAADGQRADIDAALARFPASARIRHPVAIGLRALRAVTTADIPGAISLLKRGIAHAHGRTREYLLDFLIPLLINTNQLDEAREALDSIEGAAPELTPAFVAVRAVAAARTGNDAASAWYAREALELGRTVENPTIVGRVLGRTATAAFYREDFGEAQDRGLEAARYFERLESHRNAALSYSVLYVLAHDWAGDQDLARFYARKMTMNAHLAQDASMEHFGVLSQLDIAAEAGDERRVMSLRARLLANPRNEQFYRERFVHTIADALAHGWAGRFDAVRVSLQAVRNAEGLSLPERSLCDALLAVAALSAWHTDLARRLARRAISETSDRSGKEPLLDARRRHFARIVAAAVCIVLGDGVRGRRALSRSVDPDQIFAGIIDANGMDEERTPALMRGYAKFLNVAVRLAGRLRPSHGLTAAEIEVLKALPSGTTLATIALSLGKSKKTVERQVGNIYAKLHVANRTQAVERARDLGIYA